MRCDGDGKYGGGYAAGARHRADETPSGRIGRTADAKIALPGDGGGQPDGCRVEHGRHVVDEQVIGEAPPERDPISVRPRRGGVEPDPDRNRADARQCVGRRESD